MVKTFKFNSTATEEEIDNTINEFMTSSIDMIFTSIVAITSCVDVNGNIIYTVVYKGE